VESQDFAQSGSDLSVEVIERDSLYVSGSYRLRLSARAIADVDASTTGQGETSEATIQYEVLVRYPE
jgi:hypothetical protein